MLISNETPKPLTTCARFGAIENSEDAGIKKIQLLEERFMDTNGAPGNFTMQNIIVKIDIENMKKYGARPFHYQIFILRHLDDNRAEIIGVR